jgi:ethanolamine ammonia-lyase large subunit
MGSPVRGSECGVAHIGGAKTIRTDDLNAEAFARTAAQRAGVGSEGAVAARERPMIDWDDVRYFLAAALGGSVRGAANRLGVNHSTVLRRIAQLEERLATQMFEKLPSACRLPPAACRLTSAGEEVLELAEQMEAIRRTRPQPAVRQWKRTRRRELPAGLVAARHADAG